MVRIFLTQQTSPKKSIMQRLNRKPAAQQDLFATDSTFLARAKKRVGTLSQLHKLFPFESYRQQITKLSCCARRQIRQETLPIRTSTDGSGFHAQKHRCSTAVWQGWQGFWVGDVAEQCASGLAWDQLSERRSEPQIDLEIQGDLRLDGSAWKSKFQPPESTLRRVAEKFGKSKGNYNIQTVNAFHSDLKDFVNYRFNGVATKYLNNYATWHGFLHSPGVDQDEAEEFLYEVALTAVCPSAGKQVSDREAMPMLSEKQKRFMEILLMNLASQELQDRIDALERLRKGQYPENSET